jgi:CheY-like chemotaxis protein
MKLIKTCVPDLILLDISMPVKSGFECMLEMREMGLRSKIIAQTVYASTDEKRNCFELGCHGYIAKPVKKDELLALIGNVLSS